MGILKLLYFNYLQIHSHTASQRLKIKEAE